jgi:hypothetical protein
MLSTVGIHRKLGIQVLMIGCVLGTLLVAAGPLKGQAAQTPDQMKDIHVFVSIMDPRVVSDTFGKRVAQRFVAIQVTIGNHNKDYQYLINDVSLDLKKVFPSVLREPTLRHIITYRPPSCPCSEGLRKRDKEKRPETRYCGTSEASGQLPRG